MRARVMLLFFLGAMLMYSMRTNISIALDSERGMARQFGWGDHEKGIILSAFLFGYFLMNWCGGFLADRLGGHPVVIFCILGCAICSALTPAAAYLYGAWGVVSVRFLLGCCQGSFYPCGYQLITQWIPFSERAKAAALNSSGGTAGTVVTWSLFPLLVNHSPTWTGAFYVPAAACLAWSVVWWYAVTTKPEDNRFISRSELRLILATRSFAGSGVAAGAAGPEHAKKKPGPNLWRMATSPAYNASIVVAVGACFSFYVQLTFLPQYVSTHTHRVVGVPSGKHAASSTGRGCRACCRSGGAKNRRRAAGRAVPRGAVVAVVASVCKRVLTCAHVCSRCGCLRTQVHGIPAWDAVADVWAAGGDTLRAPDRGQVG